MSRQKPVLFLISAISVAFLIFTGLVVSLEGGRDKNGLNKVQEESSVGNPDTTEKQVILLRTDPESKTIEWKEMATDGINKLNYTGGTKIKNKYGKELSVEQIESGEIADIVYRESDRQLLRLQESADVWKYTDVKNFSFDQDNRIISLGNDQYQYDTGFCLLSDGKEIDFIDLDAMDVLTVRGNGKKIYSAVVTKGHGYLTLKNDSLFLGGWIEVDAEVAKPISKDMLLAVPEGNHNVTVTNNGIGGTKSVTINRGETVSLDVGEFKAEISKTGSIQFHISPKNAKLYINQKLTDYSQLVRLDYGTYRIEVTADGYQSYVKKLILGSTYAEITIDLENNTPPAAGNSDSSSVKEDNQSDSSDNNISSIKKIDIPDLSKESNYNKDTSVSSDLDSGIDLDSLLGAFTGTGSGN